MSGSWLVVSSHFSCCKQLIAGCFLSPDMASAPAQQPTLTVEQTRGGAILNNVHISSSSYRIFLVCLIYCDHCFFCCNPWSARISFTSCPRVICIFWKDLVTVKTFLSSCWSVVHFLFSGTEWSDPGLLSTRKCCQDGGGSRKCLQRHGQDAAAGTPCGHADSAGGYQGIWVQQRRRR